MRDRILLLLTASVMMTAVPCIGQESFDQNVRLTFQLVEANGFDGIEPTGSDRVHPSIVDVVKELREVFRFGGYRLLHTSMLRGVLSDEMQGDGHDPFTQVRQRIALEGYGTLEIQAFLFRTPSPDAVRISVHLKDASDESEIIDASVTIRNGSTVVLGSGRPDSSQGALILVMSMQLDGSGLPDPPTALRARGGAPGGTRSAPVIEAATGPRTLTVTILNNDFKSAVIYAKWSGGIRERVGLAIGNTSRTYTIEWQSEVVRFDADFVAGGVFSFGPSTSLKGTIST